MSYNSEYAMLEEDLDMSGYLPDYGDVCIDEDLDESIESTETIKTTKSKTKQTKITKTKKPTKSTKPSQPISQSNQSNPSPSQATHTEIFNQHKLYHIIQHTDEYKAKMRPRDDDETDPFVIMTKYLAKSKKGSINVTYNQREGRGRLFPNGSLSLASMPKEIRHTIASEYYVDIDMVNAHPVILSYLCDLHNIEHDELTDYIENREPRLAELEVDRELAKKIYLTIVNGKSDAITWVKCKKTKNLKLFAAEMKTIRSELIKAHDADYKKHRLIAKKHGRTDNFDGSFMNVMLCDMENKILNCMMKFFGNPDDAVLCFDGVMLRNTSTYNLTECEKYLKSELNIDIKLAFKPMNLGFTIDNPDQYDEIDLFDVIPFDRNDPYVWNDLLNEYNGQPKFFETYEDLCNELLPKLRKVVAYIAIGRGMYVRKINNFEHLFNMCPSNTDLILKFKVGSDKKEKTVSSLIKENTKTLVYSSSVVKPDLTMVKQHELNFWSGIKAVETKVDMAKIEPILDIFKTVWAAGDPQIYKGILYYLRNLVRGQHLLNNKECAMVLVGDQGCGKDFPLDFISWYVLGRNLVSRMVGIDQAVGSFNSHLCGKVLCVINEMASTREEFRSNFDKIKPCITNKDITINEKGIPAYPVENISSWILMSNHDDILYLEKGDRRYFCLKVDPVYKGNRDHFKRVADQCFNDECGNMFYSYLMSLQDSDVIHPADLPMTSLKREMIENSASPIERFVKEIKEIRESKDDNTDTTDEEDTDDGDAEQPWQLSEYISASELFEKFGSWCKLNNEKFNITSTKFGTSVGKLGLVKERLTKGRFYNLTKL